MTKLERNKMITDVKKHDTVVCIKKHYTFIEGGKYKIDEVDDDFVTVYRTEYSIEDFPRIQRLNQLLEAYENCEHEDVKEVLDVTLEPILGLTYFEDIFISLKEQRRRKLEKIMETDE